MEVGEFPSSRCVVVLASCLRAADESRVRKD